MNRSALAGPSRPLGSPEIPQFHLSSDASSGVYTPHVYGAARIHFVDKRRKIEETRLVAFTVPLEPGTRTIDWDRATAVDARPEELVIEAPVTANYLPLPKGAMDTAVFARWAKGFDRWLARTQRLEVTPRPEAPEITTMGPKRGGVSVELVAVLWRLT